MFGVLPNNGEGLIDASEAAIGEGVGFVDVGLDVAVGTLQGVDDGGDEGFVAVVGKVEGLLTVGVGCKGGDGVGDDRVGGQMLMWAGC